jgi:hypothetical protein
MSSNSVVRWRRVIAALRMNELLCSLFARHFSILTPDPATVRIHPDLAIWLAKNQPEKSNIIRKSGGLNFATRLLTDAATWPTGRALPESMIPSAAYIFAFDALVDNDDRRLDNPNVLVRGDSIYAIDHELAFAFLYLTQSDFPWQLQRRGSISRHVFYFSLRKQLIELDPFIERLAQLGEKQLQTIIEEVPTEWRHNDLGRISDHLKAVREHASEFHRELLGRLAS